MEGPGTKPGVPRLARNFYPEPNARRQGAGIRRDRNAAAGLGFPRRDAVDFRVLGRVGEDRGPPVKLSDFGLGQVSQGLDAGIIDFTLRLLRPCDSFRAMRVE